MLDKLHIKNIGIIEELEIDFKEGLNVLTGETGAGKSLIINSIGYLTGNRFFKENLRKSEKECLIEAIFYDDNKQIIISRSINIDGKNVCKVNGNLVTVAQLKQYTKNLIEIHGQLENVNLLNDELHITYLDSFCENELKELKNIYLTLFENYTNIKQKLKNNFGGEIAKQRQLDLLSFQINEIENANLKKGEEEKLEQRKKILQNAKIINENANILQNSFNSVLNNLNASKNAIDKISCFSKDYMELFDKIKNVSYDIEEISYDIKDKLDIVEYSDDMADEIENRLEMINDLKRKYGKNIDEILNYLEKVKKEYEELENNEELIAKLKEEFEEAKKKLKQKAQEISKIRKKQATIFEIQVNKILKELDMKNANFKVQIQNRKNFAIDGIDEVIFYIKTNKGEDYNELSKIASGGEMSRIMLAIKSQIAKDNIQTIIFDEIDTGISGNAANAVSKLLYEISKQMQVICISHLPNIAAIATTNYYISKHEKNGRTVSNIKILKEDEVIDEIARISAGKVTNASYNLAKELRKLSNKKRQERGV